MNVPNSISIAFAIITFTTVFIFFIATRKNKKALIIISAVMLVHAVLSYLNFYSMQPLVFWKVPLVVAPSFLMLFYTTFSKRGQSLVGSIDIGKLTLLHTIRILVEVILFLLFTHETIPVEMTFEGRNIDILAGITAPIVYYFTFVKNKIGPKGLLAWNILCLLLLINIIITSVLSFELPFQQLGFEQPNRAILFFPFVWLPSVVVPIVFFSHLVAIKRLLSKQ